MIEWALLILLALQKHLFGRDCRNSPTWNYTEILGVLRVGNWWKINEFWNHLRNHLQFASICPIPRDQQTNSTIATFGYPGGQLEQAAHTFKGDDRTRLVGNWSTLLAIRPDYTPQPCLICHSRDHVGLCWNNYWSIGTQRKAVCCKRNLCSAP